MAVASMMTCKIGTSHEKPYIADRAIHHGLYSNGWVEFWPKPMNFLVLVDKLNHVH